MIVEILLAATSVVLISSVFCAKQNYAPSVPPRPRNVPPEKTKFEYKSNMLNVNEKLTEKEKGSRTPEKDKKLTERENKIAEKEKKDGKKEEDKKKTERETKKEEEKKKTEREKEVMKREEATQVSRIKTSEPAGDDDGKRQLVSVGPSETFVFPYNETSQQRMLVKNLTKKTVIFKIRASCLDYYRIAPVFAIIPPEGSTSVFITHIPSGKKEDKLYVVNTEAPKDVREIDLPDIFKPLEPVGANVRVKLIAK